MKGLTEDTDALTILDVWSRLKNIYPLPSKSAEDAYDGMQHFTEGRFVSLWYSDNSGELEVAAKKLCFPRETSLPSKPQNNAIAERNNKDILQGTRTTLIQAGLPPCVLAYGRTCLLHV